MWRWLAASRGPPKALSSYGNTYKLIGKHLLNSNTNVYRFGLPSEVGQSKWNWIECSSQTHVLGLPVGQHIMLGPVNAGKDAPSRPYTPITIGIALQKLLVVEWATPDQTTRGYFDLLIKTYPSGRLTPWINQLKIGRLTGRIGKDFLSLGDGAFISGPFGSFTYQGKGRIHVDDEITGDRELVLALARRDRNRGEEAYELSIDSNVRWWNRDNTDVPTSTSYRS